MRSLHVCTSFSNQCLITKAVNASYSRPPTSVLALDTLQLQPQPQTGIPSYWAIHFILTTSQQPINPNPKTTQNPKPKKGREEKKRERRKTMVCSKCQKKLKSTELATPGVKRKSEMYYGSPSTSVGGGGGEGSKSKPTLGNTGIGKVCYVFSCFVYYFCGFAGLCRLECFMNMEVADLVYCYRASCLVRRLRILMRLIRLLVRVVRRRRSRGGSFVRGVLIRRMVRFFFPCDSSYILFFVLMVTLWGLLIDIIACPMCGRSMAGKSKKDQPIVQGQKFNLK